MAIEEITGASTAVTRTVAALEVTHPSEHYLQAILHLLPRGPAWTRRLGSVVARFLQGIFADEALRIDQRLRGLVNEADPNSTVELLDDWERVLGLPSTCITPTTIADRQDAIVAKIANREGPTDGHLTDLASDVGFVVTLVRSPYTRLRCDSAVDQPLYSGGWHAVFRVLIDSFGASTDLLKCVLNAAKRLQSYCEVYRPIGTDWTPVQLDTWEQDIHGIAWDRLQTLVAVGGYSSPYMTKSLDGGHSWSSFSPPGTANRLRDVCHNLRGLDPLWFAVGLSGTLISSPDGVNWTDVSSGSITHYSVCCDCKRLWRFVAVGTGGHVIVRYYTGGTSAVSAGTYDLFGVCHGDSYFLAVGQSGSIQTSTTGTSWTARTPDAAYSGQFNDVCWTGENYVAVGSGGEIQTSPDGETWTERKSTGNDLQSCSHNFTTGQTFAVGNSGDAWVSEDHGETWEQLTTSYSYALVSSCCTRFGFLAGSALYAIASFRHILLSEEGEY